MLPTSANCRGQCLRMTPTAVGDLFEVVEIRYPPAWKCLPAWEEYHWEGNVLDCSIDDDVRAWYPATILVRAGRLMWKPGTREWLDPSGTTVAPVRA